MSVHPRFSATTIPELEALVSGLAGQGYAQMADPNTRHIIPALYGGKIRYRREPLRRENWQSALETAGLGYGDCEDLAAYRVAELRSRGILAFPMVKRINDSLRHVVVTYRDPKTGQTVEEDPSAKLGMKGAG